MKKEIENALKYANSSNRLEDNCLSDVELEEIIDNILKGSTDESFLFSVVKAVNREKELIDAEPSKQMMKKG